LNESDKKNFIKKIQNIEIDDNNKDEEAKVIDRQNKEIESQNKLGNEQDIKINQNKIITNEEKIINQNKIVKNEEKIINQNINLKNEENVVNQNKIFKNLKENVLKRNIENEKNKYIEEYNSLNNNNIINMENVKIKKYDENNKINNHKKQQHKIISYSSENSINLNIIDKNQTNINAFRNFKSNIVQNMKRESDDKPSFLNKVTKLNTVNFLFTNLHILVVPLNPDKRPVELLCRKSCCSASHKRVENHISFVGPC
jgi:hypothetical protein